MTELFNVYCDESCHFLNDEHDVMLIGALWCPTHAVHGIAHDLHVPKKSYGIKPSIEAKWVKVSPAKLGFYRITAIDWLQHSTHSREVRWTSGHDDAKLLQKIRPPLIKNDDLVTLPTHGRSAASIVQQIPQ